MSSAHQVGMLEVYFLNIGQGDAIYVHAPNGNSLVIDGGPAVGQVTTRIGAVTNMLDRQIDVVFATHADADHVGGLSTIFTHYTSSLFIDPAFLGTTLTYKNLIKTVSEKNIPRLVARKGIKVMLDSERTIFLDILYPNNQFPIYKYDACEKEKVANKRKSRKKCEKKLVLDTNESSVVARLTYGNQHFLFTGDAPIDVEHFLIDTLPNDALASNVLKVGHHGSKTSTSEDFVQAVSPEYAVLSVGAANKYGHPHQQTLDTLDAALTRKIKILRTDTEGTVRCVSDGASTQCNGTR